MHAHNTASALLIVLPLKVHNSQSSPAKYPVIATPIRRGNSVQSLGQVPQPDPVLHFQQRGRGRVGGQLQVDNGWVCEELVAEWLESAQVVGGEQIVDFVLGRVVLTRKVLWAFDEGDRRMG